jgi:hypothetical protein
VSCNPLRHHRWTQFSLEELRQLLSEEQTQTDPLNPLYFGHLPRELRAALLRLCSANDSTKARFFSFGESFCSKGTRWTHVLHHLFWLATPSLHFVWNCACILFFWLQSLLMIVALCCNRIKEDQSKEEGSEGVTEGSSSKEEGKECGAVGGKEKAQVKEDLVELQRALEMSLELSGSTSRCVIDVISSETVTAGQTAANTEENELAKALALSLETSGSCK